MNSSNTPFCNLYNRKCDFSAMRAAWRHDFFVMGLCSPFALRYAGQLQAGAQDSQRLLPRAALRACLPVQCWRFCVPASLSLRSAGLRRAWPQIWRVRAAGCVAAQLRPQICHGYRASAYLAGAVRQTVHADHCDGFVQALAARHGSTGAARRWYSGCGCNRFRTACVMFSPAPQGSAPR